MIARLLFAGLFALAVAVGPARADDFTIPPTPNHFVTDNAGALSSAARGSVENELQSYERATGHQILVWTGQTTGDVPLETWTGDTAHKWRVGRKGNDDGAILFLFMQDHKIRIEVGYGLESSLTDAASARIIQDDLRPRMRSGDIDGAVSSGVAAMLHTITPSYAAVSPPPDESTAPPVGGGFGLMFGLLAVLALLAAIAIVLRIVYAARYGYLIVREGAQKAKADMKSSAFWTGTAAGFIASSSSGGGGGDFGSGGFSAGGGDFGGGGASGSW